MSATNRSCIAKLKISVHPRIDITDIQTGPGHPNMLGRTKGRSYNHVSKFGTKAIVLMHNVKEEIRDFRCHIIYV